VKARLTTNLKRYSPPAGSRESASSLLVMVLLCTLALVGVEVIHAADSNTATVPWYRARIVAHKPFPRENFTQGLEIVADELFVSSGLYGKSAVRVYRWPEMVLERETLLPKQFFAEGLTLINESLYVLTWREGRLLLLDPKTLSVSGAMQYRGEGWGLTHHGNTLWLSDGSNRLTRLDLSTPTPTVNTIEVTLAGEPLRRLNELEWIDGEIWANVWQTDTIARIDPSTGAVTGMIDAQGLLQADDRLRDTDVLNGIARDPETGQVWITGKRWPKIFQIVLEAQN
jgi:glutamine cyclotransferase